MALSTGSFAAWADIQTLFTNLNTARTKFGFSTITPSPTGGAGTTITTTNSVAQLSSAISGMSNNAYLRARLSSFSVTVPSRGTLITPTTLSTIFNSITDMNNTCAFNSFRSTFNSFTCRFDGFTCSFRSSFDGFTCSFRSSFDGFTSNSNNRQFGFGYRVERSTCEF